MKTKLILVVNAIWAVLVALNESGVLDLVDNPWYKALTAFTLSLINIFVVDKDEAIQTLRSLTTTKK